MIPIRDDTPRTTTPYVTYFLVGLNLLIFLFEVALDPRSRTGFIFTFGTIPVRFLQLIRPHPLAAMVPVVTSMFLHASWLHVIFNMWGLWIFGDNVEDHLGHVRYLLFYLLTGFAAAGLHILFNSTSQVPSVGASGAIAGVMGAYFLLYPSARVLTLIPFFFLYFTWLPAWLVLGYWFVVQFLSGAATSITYSHQTGGGVAFWAHVGGFVAGLALIKLFPARAPRYRYTEWS
ncbi:MAG TPA: rhomboid family intramembrane serine protease [Terriglobales bacterium]|nr:rhomboid family intramembrane serine protease [Terriglobales bacterium]